MPGSQFILSFSLPSMFLSPVFAFFLPKNALFPPRWPPVICKLRGACWDVSAPRLHRGREGAPLGGRAARMRSHVPSGLAALQTDKRFRVAAGGAPGRARGCAAEGAQPAAVPRSARGSWGGTGRRRGRSEGGGVSFPRWWEAPVALHRLLRPKARRDPGGSPGVGAVGCAPLFPGTGQACSRCSNPSRVWLSAAGAGEARNGSRGLRGDPPPCRSPDRPGLAWCGTVSAPGGCR